MKTKIVNNLLILLGIILFIFTLWWVDIQTGYEFNFFIFYFIPVAITAWIFGAGSSFICSILCAAVWFTAEYISGHSYSDQIFAVWNALIRLLTFLIIGWSTGKIHILLQAEKIKSEKLQQALSEIKILKSFLSICCVCKKIRNEDGKWQQIESYISNHSETKFSHGYCPECAQKAMQQSGLTEK